MSDGPPYALPVPRESRRDVLARAAYVVAMDGFLEEVCERLAEGERLRDIVRDWQIPPGKVMEWLRGDDGRWAAYLRARELWAHALAEEVVEIADGSGGGVDDKVRVSRDKLRVDTRLRVAAAHAKDVWSDAGASSKGGSGMSLTVVVNRGGALAGDGARVVDGEAE